MNLWESHRLFRRVYGFKYTAATVYMARVTSRKQHRGVMKTYCFLTSSIGTPRLFTYSKHSRSSECDVIASVFPYKFQT